VDLSAVSATAEWGDLQSSASPQADDVAGRQVPNRETMSDVGVLLMADMSPDEMDTLMAEIDVNAGCDWPVNPADGCDWPNNLTTSSMPEEKEAEAPAEASLLTVVPAMVAADILCAHGAELVITRGGEVPGFARVFQYREDKTNIGNLELMVAEVKARCQLSTVTGQEVYHIKRATPVLISVAVPADCQTGHALALHLERVNAECSLFE